MPPKRAAAVRAPAASSSSPIVNALAVSAAVAFGLWLLVARGRLSWPPHELLTGAFTLAGCLALVGPIVLLRRDAGEGGVGDLLWLTGGLLIWTFDLAGLLRGEARSLAWATPLGATPMGLTMLAVLLAGWKARGASRSWSWTNVTGWVLGLFWVAMALVGLVPSGLLASR